ncbi:MAG: apolipoprotein N-acyltransferase [Deltaproteobacteria bacterium]|nr:apolipoprotein N-acyltransferase [Deltaproteobacteria bacterium]
MTKGISQLFSRLQVRPPAPGWALGAFSGLLTGLLTGLAFPPAVPGVWVVALVPLLVVFFHAAPGLAHTGPQKKRAWAAMAGASLAAGVALAMVSGGWIVNTAEVYGQLPRPLAWLAAGLGYGLLNGVEFFWFLAPPFWLSRGRSGWLMALLPLWAAVWQGAGPRYFYWSYGQLMHGVEPLAQGADLAGPAGLNLVYLPLQLALAWELTRMARKPSLSPSFPPPRPWLRWGVPLGLLALALGYGLARTAQLEDQLARQPGESLRLAAMQPNVEVGALNSNRALAPAARRVTVARLMEESDQALAQAGWLAGERVTPGAPVLVLWPESVYPWPLLAPDFILPEAHQARLTVEQWVRRRNLHLVVSTVEFEPTGLGGWQWYGTAIHLGPHHPEPVVYRKRYLIPFGEYVPLGDWIPGFRRMVMNWIPQISLFVPGDQPVLFPLENGVTAAPMICFDAIRPDLARDDVLAGANLEVLMANLAWFGKTSAPDQFFQYARFRAVENRVPLVAVGQSGPSMVFSPLGRPLVQGPPWFTNGAMTAVVQVPRLASFYTRWGTWSAWAMGLALLALMALARRLPTPQGHDTSNPTPPV